MKKKLITDSFKISSIKLLSFYVPFFCLIVDKRIKLKEIKIKEIKLVIIYKN